MINMTSNSSITMDKQIYSIWGDERLKWSWILGKLCEIFSQKLQYFTAASMYLLSFICSSEDGNSKNKSQDISSSILFSYQFYF